MESEEIDHSQEVTSSVQNLSLIPAVTPVKNRRSYPLSHSTPMMHTQKNLETYTKPITLICSGLPPEQIDKVVLFAKKFGANYQPNFSEEVTHVIVRTDPETKTGQKTFKYIQGIAFKKFVVNFYWIVDCLKMNRIIDEKDEKYEVLDPDTLESGSKRSLSFEDHLFKGFAIYCQEPFESFKVDDFKVSMKNFFFLF